MNKDYSLELAMLIGQPINTQKPVAFELSKVADVQFAEPGDHVWRFSGMDTVADVVLAINTSTGAITPVKRSPVGDVELTFTGLISKEEYVLLTDVIAAADKRLFASRKASIARAMDKRELQLVIAAILAKTSGYLPGVNPHEYTVTSGVDLYDAIMGMKHLVEDYGDGYVLLCGSTVKEKIDTYDKEKSASLNYNVDIFGMLSKAGIEVVKVFGAVSSATNEAETDVMDDKKMILVAKKSYLEGAGNSKPIQFVRRKISAEAAGALGADINEAQRALIIQGPVNVSGVGTMAYSVVGVESVVFCITNPKAIVICDATSIVS